MCMILAPVDSSPSELHRLPAWLLDAGDSISKGYRACTGTHECDSGRQCDVNVPQALARCPHHDAPHHIPLDQSCTLALAMTGLKTDNA